MVDSRSESDVVQLEAAGRWTNSHEVTFEGGLLDL
jgi:hypothetical protein